MQRESEQTREHQITLETEPVDVASSNLDCNSEIFFCDELPNEEYDMSHFPLLFKKKAD